jgi:hypothetical protein
MGLTGLEPVTLRLSSACSNQLSYRPVSRLRREIFEFRLPIFDLVRGALRAQLLKSAIANGKSKINGGDPNLFTNEHCDTQLKDVF